MRGEINRLPADAPKGRGGQIDRSRPLQFKLNGQVISGFVGDSVLSALRASGVDVLGRHLGQRIGLSRAAAPPIALAGSSEAQDALPMERTPAIDGVEFVTLARRQRLDWDRLWLGGRSLGLDLDDPQTLARPWLALRGAKRAQSEIAIVGAGVAGLSAALAAARAGLSVALLEAAPYLGGHSGLFGTQDGEDRPEVSMAHLGAEVEANPAISVYLRTEVVSVRSGLLRAHSVSLESGTPRGEMIDIAAEKIILATGAQERLPLFAGNRLPGVMGALECYELASRYGIWRGRSLAIATSSNVAYRLGTLARDNEIAVAAIMDARPGPSSRFIDFAKAYGIRQMPGRVPFEVRTDRASREVEIHIGEDEPLRVDQLIACGSWQPDLRLWHMAGGPSAWHDKRQRIEATGTVDGVVLAGSAAGYLTRQGCIESGNDAVNRLLGRKRRPVLDPVIDPLYETPDAALADLGERETEAITYLDGGTSLLTRPSLPPRRWYQRLRKSGEPELPALSEASQSLTLGTIAAGVTLGLVPRQSAGYVAQERVALIPLTLDPPSPEQSPPVTNDPEAIPSYLHGRYGAEAKVMRLVPQDGRSLEAGTLIFADLDSSAALSAIGVVLRPTENGASCLVGVQPGQSPLYARDHGQMVVLLPPAAAAN